LIIETIFANITLNLMNTRESVDNYLKELFEKIKVFDIIFEDRKEFYELQKELEIKQSGCVKVIEELTHKDYCKGPKTDTIYSGEYWEFGKKVKTVDVYIKINKGLSNKPVICISFHKAKYRMTFPLNNK